MIGVDVGGTFTDFSIFNMQTGELFNYKDSSTPEDPSMAIVGGLQDILSSVEKEATVIKYLAHGTTVATNALIENKGARTGLITTAGFKDLMEIGNQRRPDQYNLLAQKPAPLIPPGLNCEVPERILFDGHIRIPLDEDATRSVVRFLRDKGASSIAVCTLFSFINPIHEKRIKEIVLEEYPESYVTASSDLSNEFREYNRMSTTVLNSYLGPVIKNYVQNFRKSIKKLGVTVEPYITQSNGSIISISEAMDSPIKCAVSGPSAGVVAAAYIGRLCGADRIITFDMGGTSADISLIEYYTPQVTNERLIQGYPCQIPMINIITIGAGGGSIARIDEGGALKVGPQSAGANPGPASYNRGGDQPCVTDANVYLGKLNRHRILGGRMKVDATLAQRAIENKICLESGLDIDRAANGIISVVNSNMVRAIRSVSVEKGYDVRDFTLMAFGGAGPLHACEVAKELGIKKVVVPQHPGTLSSLGLLLADTQFDISRTLVLEACTPNIPFINERFNEMLTQGIKALDREEIPLNCRLFKCSLDMRYERQNFEINIPIAECNLDDKSLAKAIADFHSEHLRKYGYKNEKAKVQVINYRLSAIGIIDKPTMKSNAIELKNGIPNPIEQRYVLFQNHSEYMEIPVYSRFDLKPGHTLAGPCICEQMDTTIVIPLEWQLKVDGHENLLISYVEEGVKWKI